MKEELENFIRRIDGFYNLASSVQVIYFVYYLTVEASKDGVVAKDIRECFGLLKLHPYSNLPSLLNFLSASSSKVKHTRLIKLKGKYYLTGKTQQEISHKLGLEIIVQPTHSLFPLTILAKTRGYLERIAEQAASCYDNALYDACLVMLRKLLEILIIESFERNKIEANIKDKNGDYYYLGDLIRIFLEEPTWTVSRNAKQHIPKLKKFADLSAHNRRFLAKKEDIDNIKSDMRIVIEELVHLVDYQNWNNKQIPIPSSTVSID